MSNPQGGYPGSSTQYPYGPPQGQGQSYPQGGYGGPPDQPPAGQPPYPPYQQYGQHQHAPPPGQYAAPPQGYPPHQQQAPPPPQGYPPQQYPPQQQPPPGQHMAPPPQGQGFQHAPPPGQGYPPQQYPPGYPPQQQPPPQGQYMGAPPQGQHPSQPQYPQHQQPLPPQGQPPYQQHQPFYGAPQQQVQPAPPSVGYDPNQKAQGDAKREAEELRKAMKGFGTDEERLINVLVKPDPLRMALIRQTYAEHIGRDLEDDVKSETSGDLETGLVSLLSGPLGMDVRHLKKALSGMGTSEDALDDILLFRSNADMKAIKSMYAQTYKKSLESALKSDLSGKTEDLFLMLLNASRPEPGTAFDQQSVETGVREIHHATQAIRGTDEITVCSIFVGATEAKLSAISDHYQRQYHTSLEKVIREEFSGHMRKVLLAMLTRARDPAKAIATRLDVILSGSVDHDRLIYWLVKLHWDPPLYEAVETAFLRIGAVNLRRKVLDPISPGDFKNLLKKLMR